MPKIKKTSEFTEFVYLKNNPLGLIDDLNADYKYRSNVLRNNRSKLIRVLSIYANHILYTMETIMLPNKHDMIAAITFEIYKERFESFPRREYYSAIKELINLGIIVKVNNKNSDRRYYVNPCIICKLTKEQKQEFSIVHNSYFKELY